MKNIGMIECPECLHYYDIGNSSECPLCGNKKYGIGCELSFSEHKLVDEPETEKYLGSIQEYYHVA